MAQDGNLHLITYKSTKRHRYSILNNLIIDSKSEQMGQKQAYGTHFSYKIGNRSLIFLE